MSITILDLEDISHIHKSALSYIMMFCGPQRRPNGKMPIAAHQEIGRLLKMVFIATDYRAGVCNRINSIRSELDEWLACEYTDRNELPNEIFFNIYYHDPLHTAQRMITLEERTRHVESLQKIKHIVSEHYPDCAPLRALIKKLDSAIKSLETWGPQLD